MLANDNKKTRSYAGLLVSFVLVIACQKLLNVLNLFNFYLPNILFLLVFSLIFYFLVHFLVQGVKWLFLLVVATQEPIILS